MSSARTEFMAPYRYRPLSSPSTQIRLLELLPGRGIIQCRMKTVTLKDVAGTYEPISYCWEVSEGRIGKTCTILINGHGLEIGQNLYDALRQMRRKKGVRPLWADAICINQLDVGERNLQVPLMAKIYGGGNQTLVWLGRADLWSTFAFWSLRHASQECARHPWLAHGNEGWNAELARREAVAAGGDGPLRWVRGLWNYIQYIGTYRALASVMGRRYFTRSWIMQEVAKSGKVLIMCGKSEADWDDMSLGLQWYDYAVASQEYFEGVDYLRRKRDQAMSLPKVMKEASRSRATDPRDKLYSVLGLVSDDRRSIRIIVDYTLDCDDIFYDFTRRVIKASEKLDVLSMSRGVSRSNWSRRACPSWVWDPEADGAPDQLSWPLPNSLFPFRAARDSAAVPRFKGSTLGLNGYVLDQVAIIGPDYPSKKSNGVWTRASVVTSPWNVAHLVAIYLAWRKVAGLDDACVDAEVMEQRRYTFRRTADPLSHKHLTINTDQWDVIEVESSDRFEVLDRELARRFGTLAPRERQTTFTEWLLLWTAVILLIIERVIGSPVAATMDGFKGKPGIPGRRMARTMGGLIALCPKDTLPGDSIVLIQGSDVPFVLRSFGRSWKIVGECYVHEVMYGQAWDLSRCEILWIE